MPIHLGGTNDPWNLDNLNFIEHAELHALRFLSGLDRRFDYRHEGWPFLDENLRLAVRAEHSQRFKGPENPMKDPSTAEKVASKNRGVKRGPGKKWSEESKEKIRGEGNSNYGGKCQGAMPEDARKRTSERMSSNNPMKNPEIAKKVSEAKKGKPSPRRGATLTSETKEKLRIANLGQKRSPETRKKMSESKRGKKRGPYKKWSEEDKKAHSERMKKFQQKRREANG